MEKPQSRSFEAHEAADLLRRARTASLGTIDAARGAPYVSLVNLAADALGFPVILISRLAWHTRNLMADPRGSLLAAEPAATGDALTGPRVTVIGRFEIATSADVREAYLARHPEARVYVDFSDFGFWRLQPDVIHAVAGFGRIETFEPGDVFGAHRP